MLGSSPCNKPSSGSACPGWIGTGALAGVPPWPSDEDRAGGVVAAGIGGSGLAAAEDLFLFNMQQSRQGVSASQSGQ